VLLRWQAPQPCRSRSGTTVSEAVDPYASGYASPYASPTPATRVPPSPAGAGSPQLRPPRGASRPRFLRPTSPTQRSGAARPSGCLRAIDSMAWPRSWRTAGPRRLRRQSKPALAATQGGLAVTSTIGPSVWDLGVGGSAAPQRHGCGCRQRRCGGPGGRPRSRRPRRTRCAVTGVHGEFRPPPTPLLRVLATGGRPL